MSLLGHKFGVDVYLFAETVWINVCLLIHMKVNIAVISQASTFHRFAALAALKVQSWIVLNVKSCLYYKTERVCMYCHSVCLGISPSVQSCAGLTLCRCTSVYFRLGGLGRMYDGLGANGTSAMSFAD